MTLQLIIAGSLLMAACLGFVALFLLSFYRARFTLALIFKGIASLCFVIFGAAGCLLADPSPSSVMIFIGLCFGILGDEVIALCQVAPKYDTLAFVGGGSFFIVGHIFYLVSMALLGGVNWLALALSFVVMSSLSGLYAWKRGFLNGKMKIPLSLYLALVVFVGATAIGCLASGHNPSALLLSVGGILFAISDNILFAYKYGREPKFYQNIILHLAYYLAQFAIAFSVLWIK